jgi:hypothetical protein
MEQFYEQINEANALIEAITLPQTSTSSREFYFDDLVWSNILSFIKIYKKRNLKFSELKLNEWYKCPLDRHCYSMIMFKHITPKYVTFDYKNVGYRVFRDRGTLKKKIKESRIPYEKENDDDFGMMPVERIHSPATQYHPSFYLDASQLVLV